MEHLSGGDVDAQAMHASVVVGEAMRSEEQEDVRALVDGKSQAEIDALQADITAQLEALTCKLMNERRGCGTTEHVTPVSFDNEVEWG